MSDSTGLEQFAAPPRALAPWLAARILLGSSRSQVGWLVAGLGSIFFWAFAWHADMSGWRFQRDRTGQTPGEVLYCRPTRFSEGGTRYTPGTPIYENRYRYTVSGQPYEESSFSAGRCVAGGVVVVEYLLARPGFSRIAGMRRRPLGRWAALVTAFPGVGIVMIVAALLRGRTHLRFVRDGVPAAARVIEKTRTNVRRNGRRVYRMTFEYQAPGGVGHVTTRTNRPDRLDRPGALVLYDPANVTSAVLLDTIPGMIAAHESHLFLILPALTLLGNSLYMYLAR